MKKVLLFSLLVCGIIQVPKNILPAQTVNVDLSSEHQTIRGFGGMSHTSWIPDLNAGQREKAFGNKPGELGLSMLRIHVDPDTARFKYEIPTAFFAIQKGVAVFATPWNAPPALLDTNTSPSRVDPAKYAGYVAHLNAFNTYMASHGAPLYAISVQNEPDYSDWTRWTSDEMLNFLKGYGQNINNKVIAPESYQFKRSFTDPLLNDSTANAHFDIVGGHIYGDGLFDYPLAREKGKEVWMTEHYTDSKHSANQWPLALDVATEINNCMKANFNAYVWWYIRRSYGLITEDGNLSKRGYIMSQFSKFVRPGYIRADATVSSATGIDATAYKTDSSLVIIVVNTGTGDVNLTFTIQNGSVDSLVKYTTSATKNVHNDSIYKVTGGTFTATVDAGSITTFSSLSGNAEKYGNISPVAVAGDDLDLTDTDGNGTGLITLDGSSSSDADGNIVNYNWSVNGTYLSSDTSYDFTAEIGGYQVVLTVTDNDGATSSDTMNINVASLNHTEIWLEAECGEINGDNWATNSDAGASNGKYVAVKITDPKTEKIQMPTSDSNNINFPFHISEPGLYKVWGRVITPSPNDDSFWISMDDSTWVNWNSIPAGNTWHWDDVHDQSNDNPMSYRLDTGNHVLRVCYREDGAELDKLYLTNTGNTPSDFGSDANNCPVDTTPIPSAVTTNFATTVSVFPNPARDEIQINRAIGFNSIEIVGMDGRIEYQKFYSCNIQNAGLHLTLKPGVYFIMLRNKNSSEVRKLIIQ